MAVVCDNNRHNRHTSLNSKVEGALFKGKQRRLLGITPRALGKHVDALLAGLNLGRSTLHGRPGILGVCAVDKDAAAQRHEPANKGNMLERRLGCDAAVLGEHGAEHEDVEL